MSLKAVKTLFLLLSMTMCIHAHDGRRIDGDDTAAGQWPEHFMEVSIPSSSGGSSQKAMFYRARSRKARPLIVSLHSWSGDYRQADPIAASIPDYDYHYLHPDFRGPNNNPQACGSPLVLSDLEDAIRYVLGNASVDPEEVHIAGSSGGGYATLLAYMNVRYPVKSFSAWVPISNLVDWYRESVGRKQKYAQDILTCTGSKETLDVEEAKKRSPYFQKYPVEARKNARLFLYAGIHDGYQGSVPITQSIDMYNRLASEIMPGRLGEQVPDSDRLELVVKRCYLAPGEERTIGTRKLHYQKRSGTVILSIFEGGHEQIVDQVIPLIPIDSKYKLKPEMPLAPLQ